MRVTQANDNAATRVSNRDAQPLVVLDLDGTLISTRARHYAVYAEIMARWKAAPRSIGAYWKYRVSGASNRDLLRSSGFPENKLGEADRLWNALIEAEAMLALDSVIPGAKSWLARAASRATLALITLRSNIHAAHDQLQRLGLAPYFRRIVIIPHCAKPAHAKADAATALGERDIFAWIGDTEVDIEAARSVGAAALAVESGMRRRDFLRDYGASAVYESVARVPQARLGRHEPSAHEKSYD